MKIKTERFTKSLFFGSIFIVLIVIVGEFFLKFDSKVLGFTLISCALFNIYDSFLKENKYFANNKKMKEQTAKSKEIGQ